MVAEESPFSLWLLRDHTPERQKDREYLAQAYHSLADAPKNRDTALLFSLGQGSAFLDHEVHRELRWMRSICREVADPGRLTNPELEILLPEEDAVPEEMRGWREPWLRRLQQGGMLGDRFILLAALALTRIRGVFPAASFSVPRNGLVAEIPTCALDSHTKEGKKILAELSAENLPPSLLKALWFHMRSGVLAEAHRPLYCWPDARLCEPSPEDSIWYLPSQLRLRKDVEKYCSMSLEKIWAKLEPEIEFRSRQALTALLDREQAKPRQLSLFD